MNFTKEKQKGVFGKRVAALKKYSFLLLLLTFLLSACSDGTKVSNNQGADGKSDEKRVLTYDEKTLFYAFLRINHVDMMEWSDIKGIGGCMADGDNPWSCNGPNAFEEKQENEGLSGTYHIANYIDRDGQNHVLLVLPSKFTPMTINKTNIFDWTTNFQAEEDWRWVEHYENLPLEELGKRGLDFEELMKEPEMIAFNEEYNLDWREIKVNKDLTFE